MKSFAAGFILFFCFSAAVPIARAQEPYKGMLDEPRAFHGTIGTVIDPSSLSSISIGLFAPFNQGDAAARDLYRGAKLAIEQANAAGGYRGVGFSLVRRWAGSPWGAGSKEVVRLVYGDRVWAIIAFRDGCGHIAQQIAAKAYVPVIAPISSDSSLTHAGVPWIFRLPPDDRVQARILVKDSILDKHLNRVGLVSGTDQNSRAAAGEMEKELNRQKIPAVFHFQVSPDLPDFQAIAERIRDFQPRALILCLQAPVIPKLLKSLRGNGIVCPAAMPWTPGLDVKKLMLRQSSSVSLPSASQNLFEKRFRHLQKLLFIRHFNYDKTLQEDYRGAIYMVEPFQPAARKKTGGIYQMFSRDFKERFGVFPTCSAAYAYDAARMIILSIRSKGLNRPGIRLGLEELTGYEGVSGPIIWDNGGGNLGNPVIKEVP